MGPKELCADVIGTPWLVHGRDSKGIDCAGVADLVLRRLGKRVPSDAFSWSGSSEWDYLGERAEFARELGDVLVSKTGDGDLHVSILVDERTRTFATSSKTAGCVLVRGWAIRGVVGAYRWPA